MNNAVNICNLALSHLGEVPNIASISPPEGSSYSEICATYYPIAHRKLLEEHNWSFAIRRATLARLADTTSDGRYRYALPADFVRVIDQQLNNQVPQPQYMYEPPIHMRMTQRVGFEIEGKTLISSTEAVELIYLSSNTDVGLFSAGAQLALSHLVASLIGSSVRADVATISAQKNAYEMELSKARADDANMNKQGNKLYADHLPTWMLAR